MSERLLFVTGRLAAPALRDALGRADLPFDYDVAVMKLTVAALMTTDWIARRLEVPEAVTRIMIPGMCEGDVDVLSDRVGVPAEKGPADLKALPSWFGQADARLSYGERDIRVFAEINHVPRLDRDEIFASAMRISSGSRVSMLSVKPRALSSRITAGPSSSQFRPSESPRSMTSAPAVSGRMLRDGPLDACPSGCSS